MWVQGQKDGGWLAEEVGTDFLCHVAQEEEEARCHVRGSRARAPAAGSGWFPDSLLFIRGRMRVARFLLLPHTSVQCPSPSSEVLSGSSMFDRSGGQNPPNEIF